MILEQRIDFHKQQIKNIWHLRNDKNEISKEVLFAIKFSIKCIREYQERIGE
jgi:hypothetical protein